MPHDSLADQPARQAPTRQVIEGAVVALLAVVVFAGTLSFELVWDDRSLLPLVERAARDGGIGGLLRSEYVMKPGEHLGYYRPVVLLSLWLDARLAAWFPPIFHLTNVLLHAATSVLTLLLLRRIARAGPFALAGALLFAVHPVHTEAVAFVSGRTDLWAALFALTSTLLWLRAQATRESPSGRAYLGSLVALLAAVLSKELSLMLPAAMLVIDACQPQPGGWWERNRRWLAGWLVVVVAGALRWGVAEVAFGLGGGADGGRVIALFSQPTLVLSALVLYFRLLLVPWPLNAYYTVESLGPGWVSLLAAAALVAGCGLLAAARHRRAGLVSLAWILLFLAPVLGVVPISSAPAAERFLYLPSVGLALLATAGLAWAAGRVRRRAAVWAGFLAVLILFSYATVARSTIWRNGATLFASLERTSPSYVAQGKNNLGVSFQSMGRHQEAMAFFRQALELQPRSPEVLTNLGMSLLALGRSSEAMDHLRRALEIRPDFPDAHYGLGQALLREGRIPEAMAECAALRGLGSALAGSLCPQVRKGSSLPGRDTP